VLNVAKEAATPFVGDKSLGLTYMHIPIIDDEAQDVISIFNQCISFIGTSFYALSGLIFSPDRSRTDDCLQRAHGKVLVHCVEGKSRSAIVTAAYLVQKKRISADEALRLLRLARPIVSPNRGFVSQLRIFEASLHE
jgi:protein tyrosine phosphatase (PTP) superfamily phosphohydrolase (DUF442 family)